MARRTKTTDLTSTELLALNSTHTEFKLRIESTCVSGAIVIEPLRSDASVTMKYL